MSTALEAWAEDLRDWGIPQEILDRAPASPWSYPAESFRRRTEQAIRSDAAPTPTTRRALEALPEGGVVLDVGVGAGAASLPIADRASRIVGVDASEEMLAAFREGAERAGVAAETVLGRWPDVGGRVPRVDVVVCAHVLYNVQELEHFVRALDYHARVRVVMEATAAHPLAWMAPLWLRFHGLRRPDRPTIEDAVAAFAEMGIPVETETELRRSRGGFERREDAVAMVRRRICLPAERDPEIAEALGARLTEREGLWSAGPPEQAVVTIWWDRAKDQPA